MKYIKEYKNFINEHNNNNDRDFEFSIFSLFRPFTKMFSNFNTNNKLTSVIHGYDEYLYNVYVEYISKRNHISKNDLENSEIKVVGKDNKVHVDIEDDYSDNNDEIEYQNGTSGINNETPYKPEKYTAKKSLNINSPYIDEVEANNFAEMIDEYINSDNLAQLRSMKAEYNDALRRDTNKQALIKKDISSYNMLKKKLLAEILTYEKDSEEEEKLRLKIKKYDDRLTELNNKMSELIIKIGQHRWYLDELTKSWRYLEKKRQDEFEAEKRVRDLEAQKIKEAKSTNDWRGGAVYDLSWSNFDMEKINNLINPYHVEEFHLKANVIIKASNDPEKAKEKWDIMLNSLYKKWYYTFDVKNLRNLSPKLNNKDKKQEEVKQGLAYSTLILEDLFHNIKSYSYKFRLLKDDRNKYFILLSESNMLLIKKIVFKNDQYCFQLLSLLKPNKENNNVVATKLLNTSSDTMEIHINDKEISLYKENRNYPIFFIEDGNMYTTKDFKNYNNISLRNCNIYSLKDDHFKKIMKNSGITYDDMIPSSEVFDKIKKVVL